MKFREHRGDLKDSMATCVTVADTAALMAHIADIFQEPMMRGFPYLPEKVHVSEYDREPDSRIGWARTYIVTIDGYGVLGFTDEAAHSS